MELVDQVDGNWYEWRYIDHHICKARLPNEPSSYLTLSA